MIRQFLSWLFAAILALSPAQADFGGGGNLQGFWARTKNATSLFRATCASSIANLTTYTFNGISTGAAATDEGMAVIGISAEDGASTFTVSTATVDSNAMHVLVDQGGSRVASAAIWATNNIQLVGLDTVDVSVTFSEAITSAVVCVWIIKNARTSVADSTNSGSNNSGALITLTLNPTVATGFGVGICNTALTGGTAPFTWAVLTEQEDTESTEQHYTNADLAATGASMAVTCDTGGSGVTSGAAAAIH